MFLLSEMSLIIDPFLYWKLGESVTVWRFSTSFQTLSGRMIFFRHARVVGAKCRVILDTPTKLWCIRPSLTTIDLGCKLD